MKIPWDPKTLATRRGQFARAATEAGLEVGERAHWYDSMPGHQAAEWAQEQGAGDPFRRSVFRAYFVHDQNIASHEVLAGLASDLALDADDLRGALAEERYRQRVAAQYERARDLGVTAVPTFVAGRHAVIGAHPYEAFRQLMAAVGQPPRAGA